jgi:hypothetical protein
MWSQKGKVQAILIRVWPLFLFFWLFEVVLMNLRIVKLFANIPKCPIIEFSTELMIIQLSKFEGCHYAVSASIVHNEVLTSAVTPRGTLKSPIGGVSEIRRIHRLKL